MGENHFEFECPVARRVARLETCLEAHALVTKGRAERAEDKLCAAALSCWMCPVRNAVRHMGPWSEADRLPRWDKPRESPAKLDDKLVHEAIMHTLPRTIDYRRCGVTTQEQADAIQKHLTEVQAAHVEGRRSQIDRTRPAAPKAKEAPKARAVSLADIEDTGATMARIVSERAAKEREGAPDTGDSPVRQTGTPKRDKGAPARSQARTGATGKLSLAERARLMREKRRQA